MREAPTVRSPGRQQKRELRSGFSTGTAATAAARGALRCLLSGTAPTVVAVRLPAGYFLPVAIQDIHTGPAGEISACVVKDAGDDPDVTNGAQVWARVRLFSSGRISLPPNLRSAIKSGIWLIGGEGVGVATKPGLPIPVGAPAINPTPREMLLGNLTEELLSSDVVTCPDVQGAESWREPGKPHVYLPFDSKAALLDGLMVEVEIQIPKGKLLAARTLNPRLGILGGISILGTTGIVKPFSHKAYEETIDVALSVAASSKCPEVVLSTGGKSEHFAQAYLSHLPTDAFIQIADFFAYGVQRAREVGFRAIVHSAFFGKVVKMAQGHTYTHAHKVPLDLLPLAQMAKKVCRHDDAFCQALASANTARQALEFLLTHEGMDVVKAVTQQAANESARLAGKQTTVRILLFSYDGKLLADLDAG